MQTQDNFQSVEELIEYMYKEYPQEHYISYPEFAVDKLGLESKYLNNLVSKENRTREIIRDWMKSLNLDLNSWLWVGW